MRLIIRLLVFKSRVFLEKFPATSPHDTVGQEPFPLFAPIQLRCSCPTKSKGLRELWRCWIFDGSYPSKLIWKNWNCWGFCPAMRFELISSDLVWHFTFKLHREASVGYCVDQVPITIYRFTDKLFLKEHWRYWSNYQVTSIRKSGKFFIEILLRLLSTQTIIRSSTTFTSRCFPRKLESVPISEFRWFLNQIDCWVTTR